MARKPLRNHHHRHPQCRQAAQRCVNCSRLSELRATSAGERGLPVPAETGANMVFEECPRSRRMPRRRRRYLPAAVRRLSACAVAALDLRAGAVLCRLGGEFQGTLLRPWRRSEHELQKAFGRDQTGTAPRYFVSASVRRLARRATREISRGPCARPGDLAAARPRRVFGYDPMFVAGWCAAQPSAGMSAEETTRDRLAGLRPTTPALPRAPAFVALARACLRGLAVSFVRACLRIPVRCGDCAFRH